MRKYLLFISLFCLSFLFKTNVLALDAACTQEEQMRLRQIANATDISYEFYEKEALQERGFTVTISGFSSDFYVYNNETGIYFKYNGDSVVKNSAFIEGGTHELPFYALDSGVCKGYLIMTKMVSLPYYNPYYKDALCSGYEEYELCKKFTFTSIPSYNDYVRGIKQYIKSKEKNGEKEDGNVDEPKENNGLLGALINFVVNNYMVFLITIIILGTSSIIFIEVRKRRSVL